MHKVLDKNGSVILDGYNCPLSNEELINAYSYMVLSRQQDTYMLQLQRQGRMLTFPPNFGEEALQVAAGIALKKDD
jgi:pyruvate dehydrogenase E1 component alpha subunit